MARASAWGLGSALAYRGLDLDSQAELYALFTAARVREGEEAQMVLFGTGVQVANAWLRRNDPPPEPTRAKAPGARRVPRPTEQPDILRPRLDPSALVARS